MSTCPFQVGDKIIYHPTFRGHGLDVMADEKGQLIPNQIYMIEKIQSNEYIVVEGYTHSGGGIYWTEFKLAE